MKKIKKTFKAFSLAEMMVVMLVLTIFLAASMPIISKRAKMKASVVPTQILPIVTEGADCTPSTTNNTGIDFTYTKVLTCSATAGNKWVNATNVPVVAIGAACTTGVTAASNIAKTSTGTLLTCQSGFWTALFTKTTADNCTPSVDSLAMTTTGALLTCPPGATKWMAPPSSGGPGQALYLYHDTWVNVNCPSGWTSVGNGQFAKTGDNSASYVRTCYNTSQTCSTIYIYGGGACPSDGWSDAGSGDSILGPNGSIGQIRSCYKCS